MGWCPKCKREYEDNVKVCKECNVKLVDHLEKEKFAEQKVERLINVASMYEANIIISLLKSYDIPALYKSKGSGEYLQVATGINYQGVDIYVPVESMEKAKEIIEQENKDNIDDNMLHETQQEKNEYNKRSNKIGLIILIIILLFVGIPIVIGLFQDII
ncbi:hypothetical protein SH1V18_44350 [Vallitalea longa]|uniref:DUF2007 domain-containing protein n=1 Tax=Vallitalea longa TaxID=2936439 RepID=A0A9W5YGA0_9FIRM|nr:DUF2007 domain-containing protein [Vallitalea longa]GKX31955.1 hypothetical protein SH1V18_44350 [Vallitalea longa]